MQLHMLPAAWAYAALNCALEYPTTAFGTLVGLSTAVGLMCVYAFERLSVRLQSVCANRFRRL
jgi:hypothetical protein